MRPSACMALGCAVVLACICGNAYAYMYSPAALRSNLLVVDGVVYFAQFDGSPTALELQTGRVLLRKHGRKHSGDLFLTEHGILVVGDPMIFMMDKTTHAVLWEVRSRRHAEVADGRLVSWGKGLVECIRLDNGEHLWSYHVPHWPDVAVEAGRALVHCSISWKEKPEPMVALLDLQTGRELFRQTHPPGLHCENAFLAADRVYLTAGRVATPKRDTPFEKLLVWDLQGKQIDSIDVPSEPKYRASNQHRPFLLQGKVFEDGRVRPATDEENASGEVEPAVWLPRGVVRAEGVKIVVDEITKGEDSTMTVEAAAPGGRWRGFLPYLSGAPGWVRDSVVVDGRLLLGSDRGQVECIDIASGRSLWIYVFPTVRWTMSYTFPYGMPPRLAQQAAICRRENRRAHPGGLCLLPPGVSFEEADFAALAAASRPAGGPVVIYDPHPGDPFAELPVYLLKSWSLVLGSIVGVVVVLAVALWRKWTFRWIGAGALVMALPAMSALYFYGRVSDACTLTGKVVLLILAPCVLYHVYRGLRRRDWKFALPLLAGLLVLGYYGVMLIRYA